MSSLAFKSRSIILSIRDRNILKPKFSGGKGANLARLVRCGFNVPPFFILSNSLYQHVMKINRIDRLIHHFRSNPSNDQLAAIRSEILAAIIPDEMVNAIQAAMRELLRDAPIKALAVRSSGLAEDQSDRSFAGQLDSFLNIQDESQLIEAIKRCWASLWSERIQAYGALTKKRFPSRSMAVIVQQMVPAEYAGICFTIDTGDRAQQWLLIEAKPGSGAELAAGTVNPWRYRVHRRRFTVEGEPLAFDPELLTGLARTALDIERSFKAPQDIEWAIFRRQIFILQSRPITTSPSHLPIQTKRLWSNYFFAERFPLPVSRLGWSILKPIIENNAFREPLCFLGFNKLAQSQITRCLFGRPYTRLDVFQALHSLFPSDYVALDKRTLFYLQPISIVQSFHQMLKRIIPIAKSLVTTSDWVPPLHLRNWKRFLPGYCREIHLLQHRDLSHLSAQELQQTLGAAERLSNGLLKLHRWSITFAELLYHFLIVLIRKWLPGWDADPSMTALHRGLPGNLTVEMNIALWQMSQHIDINTFQVTENSVKLRNAVGWQSFIERFGHRSISLDIAAPTFAEDELYLIRLIQQYRAQLDEPSPEIIQRDFEQERLETEAAVLHNLSSQRVGWFKSRCFEILLRWSQQFFLLRENQRHYWHHALALKRKIALEMGRRFALQGWLDNPEQIFFLSRNEAIQALLHHHRPQKSEIITRIAQHQHWHQIHPPALIDESQVDISESIENLNKLIGIGASPGIATGIARILTTPQQVNLLQPGDILVVPTTDPGWTPLFRTIRALVMEVGGVLSHGAIIAREFGIPAVSSVDRATSRIPNGAKITVDGNSGMVIIHEDRDYL